MDGSPILAVLPDSEEGKAVEKLYAKLPLDAKAYANRAFQCLSAVKLRKMGELGRAELAVKITKWLLNQNRKERNEQNAIGRGVNRVIPEGTLNIGLIAFPAIREP